MRIIRRMISATVTLAVATSLVTHARSEETPPLPDPPGVEATGSSPEEEAAGTTMIGVAAFLGMIAAAGLSGYVVGLIGNALKGAGLIDYV